MPFFPHLLSAVDIVRIFGKTRGNASIFQTARKNPRHPAFYPRIRQKSRLLADGSQYLLQINGNNIKYNRRVDAGKNIVQHHAPGV
nr:MAG TPA: hypothetical protein [Caudoviricetes sp.]